MHNNFLKWKGTPVKDLHQMISNITNTILKREFLISEAGSSRKSLKPGSRWLKFFF
jgi:hypothetical protein